MPKRMFTTEQDGTTFGVVFKRDIPKYIWKAPQEQSVIYTEYVEKIFTRKKNEEEHSIDILNYTRVINICGEIFLLVMRPGLQKNLIHSTCDNKCILYSFNEVNDKFILPSKQATLYREGLKSTCVFVDLEDKVAEIHVHVNEFHETIQHTNQFFIEIPEDYIEKDFRVTVEYVSYFGERYNLMDKKVKVCRDLTKQNSINIKEIAHIKKAVNS